MTLMRDLRALVRSLMKAEIHALRLLGEGSDHLAYEVNRAFVLRLRKPGAEPADAAIEREVAVLALAAEVSPIPVPTVIASDPTRGAIVVTKVPGTSLFERPSVRPQALVPPLTAFLSALGGVPASRARSIAGEDHPDLAAILAEAARDWPASVSSVPLEARRIVEAFLGEPLPPPPNALMFCHNDLGAEHLLANADGTELTGVIDWSDAALADPARDLGLLLRDLGPDVTGAIVDGTGAVDRDALMARAAFYARCALLEDLAYGLRTSRPAYVEHARQSIWRTFT